MKVGVSNASRGGSRPCAPDHVLEDIRHSIMVMEGSSRASVPGFKSRLCHLLTGCSGETTCLCLGFSHL